MIELHSNKWIPLNLLTKSLLYMDVYFDISFLFSKTIAAKLIILIGGGNVYYWDIIELMNYHMFEFICLCYMEIFIC